MRELTAKDVLERISKGFPIENSIVKEKVDTSVLGRCVEARVVIKDSIFSNFYSPATQFLESVFISHTTFLRCTFNYAYFKKGITVAECIFESYLDFEAGIHNEDGQFILNGNEFKRFVNFFDCCFKGEIHVTKNKFEFGTNLLGNKGMYYEPSFKFPPIVENNKGPVDLDGEGDREDNMIFYKNKKDSS